MQHNNRVFINPQCANTQNSGYRQSSYFNEDNVLSEFKRIQVCIYQISDLQPHDHVLIAPVDHSDIMTYKGSDDEQVPPSSSTDKEPESPVAYTLMDLDIDVVDVED